jgi:hypothetical protein
MEQLLLLNPLWETQSILMIDFLLEVLPLNLDSNSRRGMRSLLLPSDLKRERRKSEMSSNIRWEKDDDYRMNLGDQFPQFVHVCCSLPSQVEQWKCVPAVEFFYATHSLPWRK